MKREYLGLLKLALTGLTEAQPMSAKPKRDNTVRPVPADIDERLEGRDWPLHGMTMTGMKRLDNVQSCIEQVIADGVPGDLIETGVWRGGTSMFMRAVLKAHDVRDRVVHVADSFEGLPPPDVEHFPDDASFKLDQVDFLSVPLDTVKAHFRRYGLLDDQVRFVKGFFRDTMPALTGRTWSVIRLDGDMYESTIAVLDSLYPGLSAGGYLIVDDFYCLDPCRKAVEDYRGAHAIGERIERIDWTGAYWRKAA